MYRNSHGGNAGRSAYKNFGCAGNGTTDDTVNFQSAINAAMSSGSRLIVDPGTYLISAPLVISSPMTMLGAGHSKSIIKLASGTIDGIDVTSLSPVQLENFRVKGVSQRGYMLALNAGASTSNLIIVGNSFEEQSMDSIAGIEGSGPGFSNIAISGNTFALAWMRPMNRSAIYRSRMALSRSI
jgi:hypothetical protein